MAAGPLEGVLVVSIDQAVAAPFAAARLADQGARVIKVERPGGDFARGYDRIVHGESAYFVWLNRGKQSVVVDFADPADAALLHRILDRADVFLHNLGPGAAERAGFGAAVLRARNPRLVTCAITGYGPGPYRDRKAYDLLIQAESGLCSVTGGPEAPGRVGVSLVDIATGLYAHAAIVSALYARERTGEGASIDVSMFDAMAEFMAVPLLVAEHTGAPPPRPGIAHPSIAPYGVFATADGEIVLSVQNDREWRRFCADVVGDAAMATLPDYADNTARVANRAALEAAIGRVLSEMSLAEVAARLDAAGIAWGRLNDVTEVLSHPHLRRIPVATPAGEALLPAPPAWQADADPPLRFRPVPALDADGAAVRREFS